jgi:hypothetical protein
MELTIDQALQQGIAAHKEGKLQEAEKLYRAINPFGIVCAYIYLYGCIVKERTAITEEILTAGSSSSLCNHLTFLMICF